MSMYYDLASEQDVKEAAVISRRRRAEEERKLRIFDAPRRINGKDLAALERQIEEKVARRVQEKQRDNEFEHQRMVNSMIARNFEDRIKTDKKNFCKEMNDFHLNCQRFEDRREFDLNDPHATKNSYPARLHDEDPRLTTSGMQIFDGEDLGYKDRMKQQALEHKAWLDAQVEEKKQNQLEFQKAEAIYEQRLRNSALRMQQLMMAEREAKVAMSKALTDYNYCLAKEEQEKKELSKQAEEEAIMAHQLNMCQSELLTETVDATSVNGPHRTQKDRFKGYSPAAIAAIREFQKAQALDCKKRQEEEKLQDEAWLKRAHRLDVHAQLLERSIQRRNREKSAEFEMTNVALSREQRMREEYRNRILYNQTVSEDFFDQFNTTTR